MLPKFLTDSYPTEKHIFLVPKFALRLIGFDPDAKQTLWMRLWATFNYGLFVYGCYAEFCYGVQYLSIDVVIAMDALCPVACSIMSLFKISCLWWYRDDYKKLVDRVRYLTESQNSKEKVKIKRRIFTLTTRLTALVLFFAISTSTSYSLRPILNNILRYFNGKDFIYETPFKMKLPAPLLEMPIYPITFLFIHWHGYITVLSFVGCGGFFLGFCMYFTTLLKLLQKDLKIVVSDMSHTTGKNPRDEARVCQKLSQIIARHNEIADLIEKFSTIVVVLTLGHFVSSSIIIGTSCIDVLLFSGYGIVVYVIYTFAVTMELFLYCLGGTAVIESSEEVATAAYCSNWYSHGVRVQKMILLVIIRGQRNITIKVPFFSPSLPALAAILRFTGSLIALVKSVL